MFRKAAVEFSALLEREIELGVLFGRGKAVPEGIAMSTRSVAGSSRSFVKVSLNMCPILSRPVGLHKVHAAANAHAQRPGRAQRAPGPLELLLGGYRATNS